MKLISRILFVNTLFFSEHRSNEKLKNKTVTTIVIIALIAAIGMTTIDMNGNAFAQSDNPSINCDPINVNPLAQGRQGQGQWTNPSPGVLCNRATDQCIHTSS
jgi:hypothetical protein